MLKKCGKLWKEPEGREDKRCELILAREKLRNSKNTDCCLILYSSSSSQLPVSQYVAVNLNKDSWYPRASEIAVSKLRSSPEHPVGTLAIKDNSDGEEKGYNFMYPLPFFPRRWPSSTNYWLFRLLIYIHWKLTTADAIKLCSSASTCTIKGTF